jgi:TPR repeat protein
VDANGAEAVRWFRQAAAQGSTAAEFWIGKCYFEGTGISRDIQEGLNWTRRAAEAGYPPAQDALGNCYLKGTGVEKDYVQAYKWFALAAAQDDSRAPDIRVSMAKTENFLTKEQLVEAQKLARDFKPAKQPHSDSAELSAATQGSGTVTVSGDQEQSEVYVDAAFMGTTPAKLKLKEGVHVIQVKRAGYADYRREIKVTAGSDLNLRAVMQKQ